MGIAIPSFIPSKVEQGHIHSAFYYGYLWTQLPAGVLGMKYGAKNVLLFGLTIASLFDLSTIFLYKCFGCLFGMRFGMGLGQAIIFPLLHQVAGAWYPLQERSLLVTIVSSGTDVGSIFSLIISPIILEELGWQWIFIVFAIASGIWAVFFFFFAASYPEEDKFISKEEQAYIIATRSQGHGSENTTSQSADANFDIPWRRLLSHRAAWAAYIAHFCYSYGWYVILGWIPQYFREVLQIDLAKKGFSAAIPFIVGYMGALFFGRFSDFLINRGFRVLQVRRIVNGTCFLSSALFMFLLRFAASIETAVVLLSITLFFGRGTMSGYWVNMVDIGSTKAGLVMGVSNTFSTIPGIVGNVVTGEILNATNDWNMVFLIAAIVLVIGAGVFHLNASDEYMFQDMEEYQHTENAEQQDGNLVKSPVLEQLDALRTNFHAHLIHLSPSTTQSKQNRSIEQFL